MDLYLRAYEELQHDRPIGMALGTIPWSSILRWAEFNEITDIDDVVVLERHIRAMERAVQEFDDKKTRKEPKK